MIMLMASPNVSSTELATKAAAYFNKFYPESSNSKVYLWVLEENFAARKFYESHGYVYTGNKKEFSDSGKYLLNYALRLKATL